MFQVFGIHEIPDDHIVYKSDYSFVFVNIRPFLKNHILVSPIRKVERVYELTEAELIDLFNCVKLTTLALNGIYSGFTINIQDGIDAGQKVFHVHVHIVPRNKNDLKRNDEIYADGKLDYERKDRSYDEMKEEAFYLRELFKKHTKMK